jgi:hypothetical protein
MSCAALGVMSEIGWLLRVIFLLQTLIAISSTSEPLPPPLATGALPLPPLPAVGMFQFGIMMEVIWDHLTLYVAVASADVMIYAVVMNVSSGGVQVALQQVHHFGSLSAHAQLPTLSTSIFQANNSSPQLCVVLAYSAAPVCSVVIDERCDNTSLATCAANTTDALVLSSSIAGIDLPPNRAYAVVYSMSEIVHIHGQRGRLDTSGSEVQAASVYGTVIVAPAVSDRREWVNGNEWQAGFGTGADEPLYLYVGNNPSITVLPISSSSSSGGPLSSVAFLLTHDSGYCPNSEINNKRADRGVCDILPVFCEGSSVINYAYGSLQSLQMLLRHKNPLSPCDPSIVSRGLSALTARMHSIACCLSHCHCWVACPTPCIS